MDMTRIETTLSRIESGLRDLIEGESTRNAVSRKLHDRLVDELTMAMRSGTVTVTDKQDPSFGEAIVPDVYTLVLPDGIANILSAHPLELDRLTHSLENTAKKIGLVLVHPPILRVVSNPQSDKMQVISEFSHARIGKSSTIELVSDGQLPDFDQDPTKPNAFLIVNGLHTLPLDRPVINIGRDRSNMVVLDDPRISRKHAQIRLVHSRFVIFDLDSTGGTYVNGIRVASHSLSPGDVIILAGLPLVYGEESAGHIGYTQEVGADPPTPQVR